MKTNAFKSADILIPKKDLEKWAVIACDQFTSDLKYWQDCESNVKNAPSALQIILPEIYLSKDNSKAVRKINSTMYKYLEDGIFTQLHNSMVYIERTQHDGKIRHGLLCAVDLEKYDYRKGSHTLIRATEETVPDRLPPRISIRKDAPLEIPHIMLLIDDPENSVMGFLKESAPSFDRLYDFDLMMGGGHISGYRLTKEAIERSSSLLDALAAGDDPLLFAVGDGNHSLAAAKECYLMHPNEKNRYALAEIVNIHDEALTFEPIYRTVFGMDAAEMEEELISFFGDLDSDGGHEFKMLSKDGCRDITLKRLSLLPVGTLQLFINALLKKRPGIKVDYVHELETVKRLSKECKTVGFLFEGMKKSELFAAVKNDGALPRKTFSMGEGRDKRYYIEARRIK